MSDARDINHQLVLLLRLLENALRAGYSLPQAFQAAAGELPEPAAARTAALVEALAAGAPFGAALRSWADGLGGDAALVEATILVQFETGGNLADKFQLVGQVLAKRRELAA